MILAVDVGGSTLDFVYMKGKQVVHNKESHENIDSPRKTIEQVVKRYKGKEPLTRICLTGGKSAAFPGKLAGVPVSKIDELEAIGRGAAFVSGKRSGFLAVSMGTGTCLVHVSAKKYTHAGGTAVGGGTFLGLARLLLKETSIDTLRKMYRKGKLAKVDLSVKDIVGGGIGLIPGDATASNLGKIAREIKFNKNDLALGIVNLIGQTIGITAVFAARTERVKDLVLVGKLTRIGHIVHVVEEVASLYSKKVVTPRNADIAVAIGAGLGCLAKQK